MINASPKYQQLAKEAIKTARCRLVENRQGDNLITISSDGDLISAKYQQVGSFLGTASKKLVCELLGEHNNLTGKTFNLFVGLKDYSDNSWHDIKLGVLEVSQTDVDYDKGSTRITLYDAIYNASTAFYSQSGGSYPITIKNLAQSLSQRLGTGLVFGEHLPNANYQIQQDPYEKIANTTLRDILREIAQATGTTLVTSQNNELYFRGWSRTPQATLNKSNIKTVKVKKRWGVLNSIVLARLPQNDTVVKVDNDSLTQPSNRNLFDMATPPTWIPPNISMIVNPIRRSSVRITANVNNQQWLAANFGLPINRLTSGRTYSVAFGKLEGERKFSMGVLFDCYRKSDNKRTILFEHWGVDNQHGKFVYQPEIYRNYRLMLLVSRGGSNVYTGEFDGTFNDIYLAEEDDFSGFVEFKPNELTEFKIVNNQILDDDRETLITPIYNWLAKDNHRYMTGMEITTEGHGYYEVGDYLEIDLGDGTKYNTFITEVRVDISTGLKETLICSPPDPTKTDYLTAGSTLKTLYNTELKTDKQNQVIEGIVSKQTEMNGVITDNYTKITQELTNITNTIQKGGGSNLIKNSVGYATNEDNRLQEWETTGDVSSYTTPNSLSFGAVSGNCISLKGQALIKQIINVRANNPVGYTLALRVKKSVFGKAIIKIVGASEVFKEELPHQRAYDWEEIVIKGFVPKDSQLELQISTDNQVANLEITDLYLIPGSSTAVWQQANGEILNTQVSLNEQGVVVKSSVYMGDYTAITPLEFAGYSFIDGKKVKVFALNKDITLVQKLQVIQQIDFSPFKIIPSREGNKQGLNFVRNN